jgi:hypothetical protein
VCNVFSFFWKHSLTSIIPNCCRNRFVETTLQTSERLGADAGNIQRDSDALVLKQQNAEERILDIRQRLAKQAQLLSSAPSAFLTELGSLDRALNAIRSHSDAVDAELRDVFGKLRRQTLHPSLVTGNEHTLYDFVDVAAVETLQRDAAQEIANSQVRIR